MSSLGARLEIIFMPVLCLLAFMTEMCRISSAVPAAGAELSVVGCAIQSLKEQIQVAY